MKIIRPGYYDQFRCLAGACPDSCCQEWDVLIDDKSAQAYLALEGSFGEEIRRHMKPDTDGFCFEILDRRCPMWREDWLCKIQAELGEAALCQVCAQFPRLRHDYGTFVELGLELSCPEAARLIFTAEETAPVSECVSGGESGDYDTADMDVLLRTRKTALEILDAHPLQDAMSLLLLYGYCAQDELDGFEPDPRTPEEDLAFAAQMALPADWASLRELYSQLDILTPRWSRLLSSNENTPNFPDALKRMIRCGIERYWLQAISDLDLICRVKMILAGALLVGSLGGDLICTAQLYSKEIDNSTDNLERILDAAYTNPALTDRHLLGLIQSVTA